MNIQLLHQHFTKIDLTSKLIGEEPIKLEQRFNYEVSYNEDFSQCKGVLQLEIRCAGEPEKLYINTINEGLFSCEGIETESDRRENHVATYSMLFPYSQHMISTLAVSSGLPPIILSMEKPSTDEVRMQNKNE